MKNFSTSGCQRVAVPLLPGLPECIAKRPNGSESRPVEAACQKRQKRGKPKGTASKKGGYVGARGSRDERTTPHAQPRLRSDVSDHEHRAGTQLEGCSRAATTADRENPPSHPRTRKAAHTSLHQHGSATDSMGAARQAAGCVFTGIAGDVYNSAAQFGSQPVAGIAADGESATGHSFARMSADRSVNDQLTPFHAGGQSVHSREVATAFNTAIIGRSPHRADLAERAGPLVRPDLHSGDLCHGAAGQTVGGDP